MGGYYDFLIGSTLLDSWHHNGCGGVRRDWQDTKILCGLSSGWMLGQVAKNLMGHRFARSYRSITQEKALTLASRSFLSAGFFGKSALAAVSVKGDRVNDQLLRWLLRDTVPALCHYEDRNSAAHGLEERFPFLDYRIAEFMFQLPGLLKTRRGRSKFLLREAMKGILPEDVVERHSKLGLSVPEDKWVRGPLSTFIRDIAASQSFKQRGLWQVSSFTRQS